jgi:hypothetical protein
VLWNEQRKLSSRVRILLDECLPRRLKHELIGHNVRTAPECGWAGRRNGELLRLDVSGFDVFLTVDRKLQYQQNVSEFDLAVVVLLAHSNSIFDIRPLIPEILSVAPKLANAV